MTVQNEIRIGSIIIFKGINNIIYVTAGKEGDKITAMKCKDAILQLACTIIGKANLCADLHNIGKQSAEARKIWKKLTEHEKTGKIAIYGLSPVIKIIALFVICSTSNKNIMLFHSKEEAENWLKEGFTVTT